MRTSLTTRVWHILTKATVVFLVGWLVVGATYENQVGNTRFDDHPNYAYSTEETERGFFTVGAAYAQEAGGGLDIGTGLDIWGVLGSFLYYAFDKSYIDKFYGGNVGGFILNFLLTGGDTVGVELDYIVNQLSVLNQKINHVIKLESQIELEIDALAKEVNFDANKIKQAVVKSSMAPAIAHINHYAGTGLLTNYLNRPLKGITATDKQTIKSTCHSPILNKSDDQGGSVGAWLDTINVYVTDAGTEGLISLLANEVQLSIQSGQDPYKAYQVMEGFFLKYIMTQAKGINLYINCAHVISPLAPLSSEVQTTYLNFLKNIVNQFKLFKTTVESMVLKTNYSVLRDAFNPVSGSTSGAIIVTTLNNSAGNILPRVDFVIDRVLGSTNLEVLLTDLRTGSADFLESPRGALTARALTWGDNISGIPLKFAYQGRSAIQVIPSIAACSRGLQRTAVWTLENGSTDRLVITSIAGWQRKQRKFEKSTAKANTYLGSPSYQIAVSNLTLDPGEVGSIGLCASTFGTKEKDGSMYIDYHLLHTKTQKPRPSQLITWSGTGTHVGSKGSFRIDAKSKAITIPGTRYSSDSSSASRLSGLPYLTWEETPKALKITGHSKSYQMYRYDFSQVPVGSYSVKGPSADLTPSTGLDVVMRDRGYNVTDSQNIRIMANSQNLGYWETFTLEDYHLSDQYDDALGKLKAANGKYVVWDKKRNMLVANSDTGQGIAFVGWTKTDMAKDIVNWGYFQVGTPYVKVNSKTQQITLVEDIKEATKFKITFIDKGKSALVEGKSYKVSLAYGFQDLDSLMSCPALLSKTERCALGQNPIPDQCKCYQFYLFANGGYPYGYFTYSPIATAGGFGKGLGPNGFGVSPFKYWKNTVTTSTPSGESDNALPSAGNSHGPHIWAQISSYSGGSDQYTATAEAYRETNLQLSQTAACKYSFTLAMQSTTLDKFGRWEMEVKDDDKGNVKYADIALHWYLTKADGSRKNVHEAYNKWTTTIDKMKPYSVNLVYASLSDGDAFNTGTIRYAAAISYEDTDFFGPDTPFMKVGINPRVSFDLTGIRCPQSQ